MVRAAVTRKPDVEDVIRGYFDTDDIGYGLKMLISHFEVRKQAQCFKVGDRVRVRKKFWYLGDQNDGWYGYAPMFADAIGTVTQVAWSIHSENWYLLVEYEDPYYRTTWDGGTFFVKDRPSSFMFRLDYVKRIDERC